jgi:hypothetical protein
MLDKHWALCQTLPIESFDPLAKTLGLPVSGRFGLPPAIRSVRFLVHRRAKRTTIMARAWGYAVPVFDNANGQYGLDGSLRDMEVRTGMARTNLCQLENEECNVQLRTIERYARALGCRVEISLVPVASATQPSQT